jgi:phosphatidylinositol glycan class F
MALLGSAVFALPVITVVLILMGAPLTTHIDATILCAAHISLLTTIPLIYVHGINANTCWEVVGMFRPMDEVVGAMVGTLVGAWLGAVPIPLDW